MLWGSAKLEAGPEEKPCSFLGADYSTPSADTKSATESGNQIRARFAFIEHVHPLAQDNIAIGFDYRQIPNYKKVFDTNKEPVVKS